LTVVDASILAAWFLDEKRGPRVEAAFDVTARALPEVVQKGRY
jgi:hypothetical protein